MEFYRDGETYKAFLKYDTNAFDEATAQIFMDERHSTTRNEASA
ncbi:MULTISPECIES: hypothetical protein [unclassified Streptomyces]|nr:hypothetical protein [Streptomyces sp. DASNCL29]